MQPPAMALARLLSRDGPAQPVRSVFKDEYKHSLHRQLRCLSPSCLFSYFVPLLLCPRIQPKEIYTLQVLYVGVLFQIVQVESRGQRWRRPKEVFHDQQTNTRRGGTRRSWTDRTREEWSVKSACSSFIFIICQHDMMSEQSHNSNFHLETDANAS